MLIDWFTVAAQIVNFLILVALLKYFLYGRIVRAMDEREHTLTARLNAAEQQRQEAAAAAAAYQRQQQELAAKQAALLAQAKADADNQRQALLTQAREELSSLHARWQAAMQHEQAAFRRDLRQRASQQVCAMARRALTDLADADLEQQVLKAFLDKLHTVDAEAWAALAAAPQGTRQPLVVHSAFDLPAAARQQVSSVLCKHMGETVAVRFETTPEVMCGIALQAHGHKIAWSLEQYLGTLEEHIMAAFEAESEAPRQEDNTTGATAPEGKEGDNGAGA